MRRLPYVGSFWWRSQYGELPPADLPNLPRELNPYERFLVRFLIGGGKAITLVVLGALLGIGFMVLQVTHPAAFLFLLVVLSFAARRLAKKNRDAWWERRKP